MTLRESSTPKAAAPTEQAVDEGKGLRAAGGIADIIAREKVPEWTLPGKRMAEPLAKALKAARHELREKLLEDEFGSKILVNGFKGAENIYIVALTKERLATKGINQAKLIVHCLKKEYSIIVVHDLDPVEFAPFRLMVNNVLAKKAGKCDVYTWGELESLTGSADDLRSYLNLPELSEAAVDSPAVHAVPDRPLVFVSCAADDDASLFDDVAPYLESLEDHADVWTHKSPASGSDEDAELAAAIEKASVALVLVTQTYITREKERQLEPLLLRHGAGHVQVFWLLMDPALWESSPIHKLKPAYSTDEPLSAMDKSARNKALVDTISDMTKAVQR